MRKVLLPAYDCTVPVVTPLVKGVVTCLTHHDAVVDGACSAELNVTNVMSLGSLAVPVCVSPSVAQSENCGTAACTTILLPDQS